MPRAPRQKQTTRRGGLSNSGKHPTQARVVKKSSPSNPQSALLGLPAELRVRIYSFIFIDSLIHLKAVPRDEDPQLLRFIWRACRCPDPRSTLLCENTAWSATCGVKERCGDKTQKWTTFPILLACRTIYHEMKNMIFSHAAISIDASTLDIFIEQTQKPLLGSLRRLTLSGYYGRPSFKSPPMSGLYGKIYSGVVAQLQTLSTRLPQLEEIAFQGKIHSALLGSNGFAWFSVDPIPEPDRHFRTWEIFSQCFLHYSPKITVVVDVDSIIRRNKEKIARFTLVREGKEDGAVVEDHGWADEDVVTWQDTQGILTSVRRDIYGVESKHDLYG